MATHLTPPFLAGVIEGFYGQPWTQEERFELLDWMSHWDLNTYVYAPKDDLNQRATWRECYPAAELKKFERLLQRCGQRNVRFVYALSPGLDIRYSEPSELERLKQRFDQMLSLGCDHFSLLFDDIPERMRPADLKRYGSLASAQCHVANAVFKRLCEQLPRARLLFCPTAYCGRMAERGLGGKAYLLTLGRELLPELDVFWTGPEIVSRQLSVAHLRELETVLRRKPVIWDNLYANDYDGRRFFCGPYTGRPPDLRNEVRGLLLNPNNELPLNFVPLRTLAEFLRSESSWVPRQAYLAAMREWLPKFATTEGPALFEDLVLFGDCYYLPHQDGPEARALYESARELISGNAAATTHLSGFREQAGRLRQFCTRLANLRERALFYALSRRIWELREELELLGHFVQFKMENKRPNAAFGSDFHLPATYRGGLVARLQTLLTQQADGAFTPASRGRGTRTTRTTRTRAQPVASAR